MTSLIYIYENELGITFFDRYFEYMQSIERRMPASLKNFALDAGRYELNGLRTLHDAWLTAFSIGKEYDSLEQLVQTSVQIDLQLAASQKSLGLKYLDVTAIQTQLTPDQWPARPVDLLVHEFSIDEAGQFRHFLKFDRGVYVVISFRFLEVIE